MQITPSILILISSLVALMCVSHATELPLEAKVIAQRRDEAIQKINSKFSEELEKVKIAYTKRGDLDSANAVVELIKKININQRALREHSIEGIWVRDYDGSIWIFDEKGGEVFGLGQEVKFTVTYDAEKDIFRLNFPTGLGLTNIVSYRPDMKTLDGDTQQGRLYQLKRIK